MSLNGRTIAVLIAPRGTEEVEFVEPMNALRARFKSFSGVAIPCGSADEHADRSDHSPGG
mgnify:CR=1 FL=1